MAWQTYDLDRRAQALVLAAKRRDDGKEKSKKAMKEAHKMRMTVAYGLERFWGEHLRLKHRERNKSVYWEETWKALVEIMETTGVKLPKGEVDERNSAAVQEVAAKIKDVGLVRADQDGALPVPAVGAFAEGVLGSDEGPRTILRVQAEVVAVLEADVDGFVVTRVNLYLHTISTKEPFVGVFAALGPALAGFIIVRPTPSAVVLQAAVDAVAIWMIVNGYIIELPQRWRVTLDPVFAAIITDVDTTVVTVNNVVGAVRVNPEVVVISVDVGAVGTGPGFTAVG